MLVFRCLTSFALCLGLVGTAAFAQDLRDAPPPAELPPESFGGAQYVDSRGCAYIRAGVSGVTTWVPRVSRSREQLCGFQPTFAQAPEPEPQPEPVAEPTPVPEIRTARSAPEPEPEPSTPETAASTTPAPAPQPEPEPARVAAPARAPAPTPAPVPSSPRIVEPEEPRVVTRAEICAGRSGILPGVINKRTGEPIDCGPDTSAALAAATVPSTAPRSQPSSQTSTAGTRLTRSELCERARRTGERFVTSGGREIRCGPQVEPITSAGAATTTTTTAPRPAAPAAPVVAAAPQQAGTVASAPRAAAPREPAQAVASPRRVTRAELCAEARRTGKLFVNSATGRELRCGPQVQSPSGGAQASTAPVQATRSTRNAAAAPVSNPVRAAVPRQPPAGYDTVWDDGRVNTQRGLQPGATTRTATVSTRSAPQASGHRFVQVGTFSQEANARQTAQRLAASGLPARIATVTRGGRQYKIVLTGPFGTQQSLGRALQTVRGAGFPDAFTRN